MQHKFPTDYTENDLIYIIHNENEHFIRKEIAQYELTRKQFQREQERQVLNTYA